MSLSEMVAQLEAELATLNEQEEKWLDEIAKLKQATIFVPAELNDRLQQALAKLQLQESVGATDNGRYNALDFLEETAAPSVLADENDALSPEEVLFDEPKRQSGIPDWMNNPEELETVAADDMDQKEASTGLNWLSDMADSETEFQVKDGPTDDDLVESFLS